MIYIDADRFMDMLEQKRMRGGGKLLIRTRTEAHFRAVERALHSLGIANERHRYSNATARAATALGVAIELNNSPEVKPPYMCWFSTINDAIYANAQYVPIEAVLVRHIEINLCEGEL